MDGLLLVEVPNFTGVRYKIGRLRTALRISKPFYRKLNLPEHLYYFTFGLNDAFNIEICGHAVVSVHGCTKQLRQRCCSHGKGCIWSS